MKKNRILWLLVAIVLSSSVLWVHAEDGDPKTSESEAIISFTASTGPTKPVDPENPGTEEPGGPDVEGALAILTASSFGFGSGKVSTEAQLFDIVTTRPNIQVVDLRGTATGWTLTAKVSPFQNDTTTAQSLRGASILIHDMRPNSLASPLLAPKIPVGGVKLTTDNETTAVVEAENGNGAGLWVMRFYPEDPAEDPALVQLEVPAGSASVGSHTATIVWELSDAV